MTQGALFIPAEAGREIPARLLARHADPDTSHRAADTLVRSGALTGQQRVALAILREHGPGTTWELAAGNVTIHYLLARRLPEMAAPKMSTPLVHRGVRRVCRIKGTAQTEWHVIKEV